MENVVQEWIEIAEYDLETAKAMLNAGRYLYVAFMCQQAVEKLLKAIYVEKKLELPPRTHNLLYFTDILKIDMPDKYLALLAQLNQFYLESRYPGERAQLAKAVDKNKAQKLFEETQEAWKCLRQILQ